MLLGAAIGGVRISLANVPDTISDVVSAADASASLILENDGDIKSDTNTDGEIDQGDWRVPVGNGAAYDAYVTVNSGALSSGTSGSAVNLGTTRTWNVTQSGGVGVQAANITVEIRPAGGSTALATKTLTLNAQRT